MYYNRICDVIYMLCTRSVCIIMHCKKYYSTLLLKAEGLHFLSFYLYY